MINNYSSLNFGLNTKFKNGVGDVFGSPPIPSKIVGRTSSWLMLFMLFFLSFGNLVNAQTTLITTADGGFENGATFADNGWTVSNSVNNPWFVGTPGGGAPMSGNKAYISSDAGATNSYLPDNQALNYFYRDITVPAGESVIKLTLDWAQQGETTWDLWQIFTCPITTTPTGVATHPNSGQLLVPAALTGATCAAGGLAATGVQSQTIYLPASLAGTTFRLVFSWKNETGGTQPPASIDNITLTSRAPLTITSAATGNWTAGATWVGGNTPTVGDNAIIADGHTVTIDAAGQGINNLTVGGGTSGVLAYATTPTTFTVLGNLTVNTGAALNVFFSTTGKSLAVAGNITNDGTIDLSKGTATTNILTLNGTTVQTVGGTGTFTSSTIRNLLFNNTNAANPNINWNFNNIKIGGNLTFTAGRVNLGTNKLILGTGTATGTGAGAIGALVYTAGGFTSGTFNRYWASSTTGSAITAATNASAATGRYPFIDASANQRSAFVQRATTLVNGQLSCTYVNATTNSPVSVVDGAYTIESRYDGNWTFSTEGSTYSAATNNVFLFGTTGYIALNGNSRILLASSAAGGAHQNGTNTPGVQRTGMSVAQLTAGALYIGAANADISQPCSGIPTPGTIAATAAICSGATSGTALSVTGYTTGVTGITFQWEQSSDGLTGWTNATGGSGATTATYTTPVLASTLYYRARITCTNSTLSDVTNVCTVSVVNCSFEATRNTGISFTSIIPTGNVFTWNTAASTPAVNSSWLTDENTTTQVAFPFPFVYRGTTVTGFRAAVNGFVTLSNAALSSQSSFTTNLASTATWKSVIAPMWDDLVTPGNPNTIASLEGASSPIKYQVDGVSPNRILTVEWAGLEKYTIAGPNLNFQVKFYETSNNIEFVYGTMEGFNGTLNTSYTYKTGMNGESIVTADATNLNSQLVANTRSFGIVSTSLTVVPECNSSILFTPGTYSAYVAPAVTAPSNDEPAGATALTVNATPCTSLCGTFYNSANATASPSIAVCTAGTAGTPDDDVWFTFVASSTASKIQVYGGNGYDSVVQLFSDSGATSLYCSNNTAAGLTETIDATGLTIGNTYYIRVYHAAAGNGTTSQFAICVSNVSVPPVNDDPCGAYTLTAATTCAPYSDNASTSVTNVISATTTTVNGVTTPTCTSAGTSVNDVWFKFTSTSTSHGITVTPVAGFDVAMQGYTVASGSCDSSDLVLTPVGCVNGGSTGVTEQVVLTTTVGQVFYFRVYRHPSGFGGAPISNSQFSICVFNPTPVCTTNTVPVTAATNQSLTPTLTWNSASYATLYDVYMGTASGAETLLQANVANTTTTTSYTLTAGQALAQGQAYYWYVVPKNANGEATCGVANETSFTTVSCIAPTAVLVPSVTLTTANLSWTASTGAPANGYEWEIRSSGAGGSGAVGLEDSGVTAAGVVTATSTILLADTVYTAYVRSNCDGVAKSLWVASSSFTTGYCLPAPTSVDGSGMTNVTIGSINNSTGAESGNYGNYSAQSTSVIESTPIPFSITYETGYTYDTKIWIDLNNDLDFNDAGENVYTGTSLAVNPTILSGTFTVPLGFVGTHRLRIGGQDTGPATPCYASSFGTFEDYTISVTAAPVCSGTPSAGTISPLSITSCADFAPASGFTATGYTSGTSGLTYQWEESNDGLSGWSNVSGGVGATTDNYTPAATPAGTMYYRMAITCSGNTGYSSAVAVTSANCKYDTAVATGVAYTSIMSTGNTFPGWQSATSGDDNTSTTVSLAGTTFKYQGAAVDGFQACSNGWMTFNTANTANQWTNDLGSALQTKVLAPFWDDLVFTGQSYTNRNACLRYLVSGTLGSGSAIITVEWAGIERFNIPGPNLNFQVKLYESDNHIEFVYGTFEGFDGTVADNFSYSIGYNGSNPAGTSAADRFALQTSGANHFSSVSDLGNLTIEPACNSMITFTPGNYSGLNAAPAISAPSNDNSAGAIVLPVNASPLASGSYCGSYFTSRGATSSAAGQACATTVGNEDDDVWFKFTTTSFTDYTIKLRSSGFYDGVLQLLDNSLTPITCVNATGAGLIETIDAAGLTPGGATYYVRVFHNGATIGSSNGQFSLAINEVVLPPTNDNISGATALAVNLSCSNTNSQLPNTLAATQSATIPLPTGTYDDDVWYSFVASSTLNTITVQSGAGYNAVMQVLSSSDNTATGTLTTLTTLNATGTAGTEAYTGTFVQGNTYFVRVFHLAGGAGTGNFTICVTAPIPNCTTNSSPTAASIGQSLTTTLTWAATTNATSYDVYLGTASGTETLLTTVSGVTSYTLTLGQALTSSTQYYWYVVPKNANGAASCGVANETSFTTLNIPPAITSFTPNSVCSTSGTTVVITGTRFVNITAVKLGAIDASSYTVDSPTQISAIFPSNATTGTIRVTNSYGTGTSTSLTVIQSVIYYADADSDTYGNPAVSQISCTGAPIGYVANNTDCNDAVASINPGAIELCGDGIDNDCNGLIDEVCSSQLRLGVCGTTVAAMDTQIYCDIKSQAQMYRFQVKNGATVIGTYDTTNYYLTFTRIPGVAYNTTYSINVALKIGGTWGFYGPSCNVTTPVLSPATVLVTKVSPTFCGATLNALDTKIAATTIFNASGYRFEITTNGVTTVYDSSSYIFKLSQTGVTVDYGMTYAIRVAVLVNGVYGNYGDTCNISTPVLVSNAVPTTKVSNAFCGTTLAMLNTKIPAVVISGASGYRFEITTGGVTTVYDSNAYNFRLSDAGVAAYGTTYAIRVAALVNGVYGNYGVSCNVTSPTLSAGTVPTTSISSAFCGTTLAALDTKIAASTVSGASGYRFEITTSGVTTVYDSSEYNFKLSQAGVAAYGTTYAIRVAALVNGVYGNYGTSCNVSTPVLATNTVPTTTIQPSFCGATLAALDTKINAVMVTGATMGRFEVTIAGGSPVVYEVAAYNFKLSQTGVAVLYNTVYSIRVAAKVGGVWGNYGASCDVTTPAAPITRLKVKTFDVSAYPNPYETEFNLNIETPSKEDVNIYVYDMLGKLVDSRQVNYLDVENLHIGGNFAAGIYNVIVSQANEMKSIRLIKK